MSFRPFGSTEGPLLSTITTGRRFALCIEVKVTLIAQRVVRVLDQIVKEQEKSEPIRIEIKLNKPEKPTQNQISQALQRQLSSL